MRILRAALIGFGLAACAWFALGARQAHEIARASSIVTQPPVSRAGADQAASLLSSAATLNPDRTVDILRGQLYHDQGRLAAARATLMRVVAQEPENLEAWIQLARSSQGDPPVFQLAFDAINRLLPRVRTHSG